MFLLAALSALGRALVHCFASALHKLQPLPRRDWFSAAGGVAVAYVFLHLLPELEHHQRALEGSDWPILEALTHHAYLLALAGLALFYGLERAIKRSKRASEDGGDAKSSGSEYGSSEDSSSEDSSSERRDFWLHIGAFALYNALIGYLLLGAEDPRELLLFAAAMALHFVVNDDALRNHHEAQYDRLGRWVMAAGVLAGWGFGAVVDLGEAGLAAIFAFLAGGIVLNVLKEELPEERESRFLSFVGGAALYALLLLVV
ncbi:hypothetical protein BH24DEI1_BH24DEI1_08740 [soil metagenome]